MRQENRDTQIKLIRLLLLLPPTTPKNETMIAEIGKDSESATEKDADSTTILRRRDQVNLEVLDHHQTLLQDKILDQIHLAERHLRFRDQGHLIEQG